MEVRDRPSRPVHRFTYPPRGSGEARRLIHIYHLPRSPALLYPQRRTLFMTSTNLPALQKLYHLDRSSPEFHIQLSKVLYSEEYQQCIPNLQRDDLARLIEYLDMVCRHVILPQPRLRQRRFSTISNHQVQRSGSVYASSGVYVEPRGRSRHHTPFHSNF